jgi:hypothetical protein
MKVTGALGDIVELKELKVLSTTHTLKYIFYTKHHLLSDFSRGCLSK